MKNWLLMCALILPAYVKHMGESSRSMHIDMLRIYWYDEKVMYNFTIENINETYMFEKMYIYFSYMFLVYFLMDFLMDFLKEKYNLDFAKEKK